MENKFTLKLIELTVLVISYFAIILNYTNLLSGILYVIPGILAILKKFANKELSTNKCTTLYFIMTVITLLTSVIYIIAVAVIYIAGKVDLEITLWITVICLAFYPCYVLAIVVYYIKQIRMDK